MRPEMARGQFRCESLHERELRELRPEGWSEPLLADNAAVTPKPLTQPVIELGTSAADFTLPRVQDGQAVRFADLHAGKPVVLLLSSFT